MYTSITPQVIFEEDEVTEEETVASFKSFVDIVKTVCRLTVICKDYIDFFFMSSRSFLITG